MPKSKKKMSYIVGGIFALLVGAIIFLLFLPSFLDKNFGFKPWDWTTIIPDLNSDFFGAIGFYMKLALPIVLFLCAVSSLFMGLSKSGGMFKGSIMASTLALVLKHSLEPANLTSSMKGVIDYVCIGLLIAAIVLAILASVFRFLGEEPYAPFRANSFHFFASYALILITFFDVFAGIFGINSILSNVNYYLGAMLGLFLIVASIWMFCTSNRDPSEFGVGYERDAKIKADQKGQPAQAGQEQPAQAAPQPGQEQTQPQMAPPGAPVPPVQPEAPVSPQAPQPAQPIEQAGQTEQQTVTSQEVQQPQQGQVPPQAPQGAQAAPTQTNPQQPPMQPRIGPDGRPLPPIPRPPMPRPPMPPRIGPDGRPLPPMPPRAPMPQRIGPDGKPLPQVPPIPPRMPMPPRPQVAPQGVPPAQPTQPAQPVPPVQQQMPQGQPAQPAQPAAPAQPAQPNGVPPVQPTQQTQNNSGQEGN